MKRYHIHHLVLPLLLVLALPNCKREDPDPGPLPGLWVVESLRKPGGILQRKADEDYSLEITASGGMALRLDVNTCDGSYSTSDGGQIAFDMGSCSFACCDSKFAVAFSDILGSASTYTVNSEELVLSGNGKATLSRAD